MSQVKIYANEHTIIGSICKVAIRFSNIALDLPVFTLIIAISLAI
ncbi:hypothetical protein OPU39_10975, partial [Acinetobacter nosocomialis]|nr:hypothetical protein [Acinetobacter nosocomialis]